MPYKDPQKRRRYERTYRTSEKRRTYLANWRCANRDFARWAHLRQRYGLSKESFLALVEKQAGKCAICGAILGISLHVDHDHKTEKIRGLLCGDCNKAIGLLEDSPKVCRQAADYLERTC